MLMALRFGASVVVVKSAGKIFYKDSSSRDSALSTYMYLNVDGSFSPVSFSDGD
jgi:hypothetical protein